MSLGVNHLRVLMSQPTDRHDKLPVPQCLAALLSPRGSATAGLLPCGMLHCNVSVRQRLDLCLFFLSRWIGALLSLGCVYLFLWLVMMPL